MALNLWIPSREGQRRAKCLEWAHPQLLEVTLDFLNISGEVEGEPQATLSLQEQPIDINQSRWCIGTQRESSTSKHTCNMSSMKTKSLSDASKKHICNQKYPLKSEDISASIRQNWQEQMRDPHLGQKQHLCYSDHNTHGWLRVPCSEPKEEGFSYEFGEPLFSKWQSAVH